MPWLWLYLLFFAVTLVTLKLEPPKLGLMKQGRPIFSITSSSVTDCPPRSNNDSAMHTETFQILVAGKLIVRERRCQYSTTGIRDVEHIKNSPVDGRPHPEFRGW